MRGCNCHPFFSSPLTHQEQCNFSRREVKRDSEWLSGKAVPLLNTRGGIHLNILPEVQISIPHGCACWELWEMESSVSGGTTLDLLYTPHCLPSQQPTGLAFCWNPDTSMSHDKIGTRDRLPSCSCHIDFFHLFLDETPLCWNQSQLTSKYCPGWKGLKGRSRSSGPQQPLRKLFRTTVFSPMRGLMCRTISWPALKLMWNLGKKNKKQA